MRCPACGFDNIQGVDRCEECMEPLRDLDVPRPKEGFQADILLDSVKDLTVFNPATVAPTDPVSNAIDVMRERGAGCVLVVDTGLRGILSEVDLLFRLPADANPQSINVSQIMTTDPQTIDEDDSMARAIQMMSVGGYRHLPVIGANREIGIVSIKDLLRYLNQKLA
jgi:CBS domain-containing protein